MKYNYGCLHTLNRSQDDCTTLTKTVTHFLMLKAAARRTDHNIDDFDTFVMIQLLYCYNLTIITRNIFMYFFKERKTN